MKIDGGEGNAYYDVLRPIGTDDLDGADPDIASLLKALPPAGYISAGDLEARGGRGAARRALEWACRNGMVRKTTLDGAVMDFESVRFWLAQLNTSKMKRFDLKKGTKRTYANALEEFNAWLPGKKFPARNESGKDDGKAGHITFQNVEEMLKYCYGTEHGAHTARHAVLEYMAKFAISSRALSTAMVHCSAIKSYFATHGVQVNVKVDKRRHAIHDVLEPPEMGLFDFYKMMTMGNMGVALKAIMMIKFQAGLDSSTLADRFNFEGYPQIVRHFGIEDYEAWDLGKCPVPVRLVRVKTGVAYTTFIDRDAVAHLQDYLRWKEFRENERYGGSGPLFVTRSGTPVRPNWISSRFSKAAINAGIQKRTAHRVFKIHSHEVRDLLKSTLLVSGCAQYAADHVLGHAPRDSYEKQAVLYPEHLRAEYAKASGRLNMFTGIENYLRAAHAGDPGPPQPQPVVVAGDDRYRRMEARQQEMREELRRVAGAVAGMLKIMEAGVQGNPDAPSEDAARGHTGPKGGREDS